jgi:hypothetical protein
MAKKRLLGRELRTSAELTFPDRAAVLSAGDGTLWL